MPRGVPLPCASLQPSQEEDTSRECRSRNLRRVDAFLSRTASVPLARFILSLRTLAIRPAPLAGARRLSRFQGVSMPFQTFSLRQLGWQPRFARRLTLADFEAGRPARVAAVHRHELVVLSSHGCGSAALPLRIAGADSPVAVGDWVLVGHESGRVLRLLERRSLVAVGDARRRRPVAANLDTLFVAMDGQDFQARQLAEHLALARDARVAPVLVLTKAGPDADVGDARIAAARRLRPGLAAVVVDVAGPDPVRPLAPWLGTGRTVACAGGADAGEWLVRQLLGGQERRTVGATPSAAAAAHRIPATAGMAPAMSGAWVIDAPALRTATAAAGRSAAATPSRTLRPPPPGRDVVLRMGRIAS
jgi:ribosome biogenesis GTPase